MPLSLSRMSVLVAFIMLPCEVFAQDAASANRITTEVHNELAKRSLLRLPTNDVPDRTLFALRPHSDTLLDLLIIRKTESQPEVQLIRYLRGPTDWSLVGPALFDSSREKARLQSLLRTRIETRATTSSAGGPTAEWKKEVATILGQERFLLLQGKVSDASSWLIQAVNLRENGSSVDYYSISITGDHVVCDRGFRSPPGAAKDNRASFLGSSISALTAIG